MRAPISNVPPPARACLCVPTALTHQSMFFIAQSNLATGAVNLSMRTIYASTPVAWGVVGGYMALVVAFAAVMKERGILLKVW